ncbi:MAG: hypothetical protein WAS05_00675 [Candidatus Nanopelagicales bacterium]
MTSLTQRLFVIDEALNAADIPHAFGGAIALAYCTQEPRSTQDLDINVFVPHDEADFALEELGQVITVTAQNRDDIRKSGQTRAWFDETPIDLFFNNHPFHEFVANRITFAPLGENTIPLLDCTSLAVFKIFFNRTKDWADLEAMNEAGQLDKTALKVILADLIGDDDPRLTRLANLNVESE